MVTTRSQGPVFDDSSLALRSRAASSSPTAQSKRLREDDFSEPSAKRLRIEDDAAFGSSFAQTANDLTSSHVAEAPLVEVQSSPAEEFVTPPTSRSKVPRSPGDRLVAEDEQVQHHDDEASDEAITPENTARAESPLLDMFADDEPVTSDHTPVNAGSEVTPKSLIPTPFVAAAEDNDAEELPLAVIDSQEDAVSTLDPSSATIQQIEPTSPTPQVLLDVAEVAATPRENTTAPSSDVQEVILTTITLSPSTTLEDLTLEAVEPTQTHLDQDPQPVTLTHQAQSSLQPSAPSPQPTPKPRTTITTTTQHRRHVRVPNRPIHIPKSHITKPSSLTRYKQDKLHRHRRNQFWGGRHADFVDAR